MKKWLQNFWYYYKVHTIIFLAVLAAALWFLSQKGDDKSDYSIAVVSPRGCSGEQLVRIQSVLAEAGRDQDGDGDVIVRIPVYRFAVGADGQDMIEISKLDADLTSKLSGLFFTEDPLRFETAVNGIVKAQDAVPVSSMPKLSGCGMDDLYLLIRTDAEEKYTALCSMLID